MIIKKINFGYSVAGSGPLDVGYPSFMYIPETPMTKVEFESAWSSMPRNIADLVPMLLNAGVAGGGFPCFNPGFADSDLSVHKNYEFALQFAPYSAFYSGQMRFDAYWNCLLDENNNGFRIRNYGSVYFRDEQNEFSWFGSGYMNALGISARDSGPCTGNEIFITSDNIVGWIRVYEMSPVLIWCNESGSTRIINWLNSLPDLTFDPYEEDNPTTIGGGDGVGTTNIPQDNITIPPIPSFSYANTGFFSIWIPSEDEIKNLARFMWNADIQSIDFWKRLISNPIELILGLSVVPFDITPTGNENVSLGLVDTGISMAYTDEQYFDIPCGEITIPEIWGAYLDYNPYTKLEIFLPYIGTRPLNADEVVGRTIRLTYRVDIVSGSCVAMIECINNETSMLLYHFSGSCSVPVPVTAFQMQGILEKTLALVGSSVAIAATGGAAIPIAGAVSSALSLTTTKQNITRSGSIGSAAGLLDSQIPYVIFTRPNKAIPATQNEYTGYPSFITETLGDLTGYTEVEIIHLNNIPCTEEERLEIDNLLKQGVIF